MTNGDEKVRFTFRMRKDLNDRLESEAKALGVTRSAYITMILQKSTKLKK